MLKHNLQAVAEAEAASGNYAKMAVFWRSATISA
jgi:hypothetical protein